MYEEDTRVQNHICGVTKIGSTGIEWICIKTPHAEIYERHSSSSTHPRGGLIFSNNPKADAHYFVNRWPNREKDHYGYEETEASSRNPKT